MPTHFDKPWQEMSVEEREYYMKYHKHGKPRTRKPPTPIFVMWERQVKCQELIFRIEGVLKEVGIQRSSQTIMMANRFDFALIPYSHDVDVRKTLLKQLFTKDGIPMTPEHEKYVESIENFIRQYGYSVKPPEFYQQKVSDFVAAVREKRRERLGEWQAELRKKFLAEKKLWTQ